MPPVPRECDGLAAEVATLEAVDQDLRTQLQGLVGAEAWAALAKLGQLRLQLRAKRAELEACVRDHSAALQANLVIMEVAPGGGLQPSRVAHLWEIGSGGATQRETSAVSGGTFSFAGPLPARLAISVATTGAADVVGPDFRSALLDAASLVGQGPIRVEAVLGPEIRIEAGELSRLVASSFTPVKQRISLGGGLAAADVSVLTADAALADNGIRLRATGQVEIQGLFGVPSRLAFGGGATLNLVPSAAPASADIFDLITVTDVAVEVGGAGGALSAVVSAMRPFLSGLLTGELRQAARTQLSGAILGALVLDDPPAGVTLSVRRLAVDAQAITLQPVLGAIGTALSAFRAQPIGPP
jgi:hypothetical protein